MYRLIATALSILTVSVSTAAGGDPPVISHSEKLLANDGGFGDFFGDTVAIDGDRIVVGAWQDDSLALNSGSAYIFNAQTGQQTLKLLPNAATPNDYFGRSVGLSGNLAIVGARDANGGDTNSGAAYLFDVHSGQQIRKLFDIHGEPGNWFGISVRIDGNTVIVGAQNADGNEPGSGAAFLFNASNGQLLHKLTANDGANFDWFGISVAVSGNIAVVGAPADDDQGNASGAAYLFDILSGQQINKLLPNDGQSDDRFGWSVAIDGDVVVVGADSDAAYIFSASTGTQQHILIPIDGSPPDRFGWSVGVENNTAIVGAKGAEGGTPNSGAAYLFDIRDGQQVAKLIADDGSSGDIGASIGIAGTLAVVGAPTDDDNGLLAGAAFVFDVDLNRCPADITDAVAGGPDGTVDVFDLLALLANWGSNGAGADIALPSETVDVFDLLDLLAAWGNCA